MGKALFTALLLSLSMGCGESGADFDGDLLVFPGDFPLSTTKDLDAGDQGGVADWYEVSGVAAGTEYTVFLGVSGEGDDLNFTVVKTADGFGPDNDYCSGLARAEDAGPSCSFVAEDAVFYMYVMRGFVEDGVEEVDYTLSVTE